MQYIDYIYRNHAQYDKKNVLLSINEVTNKIIEIIESQKNKEIIDTVAFNEHLNVFYVDNNRIEYNYYFIVSFKDNDIKHHDNEVIIKLSNDYTKNDVQNHITSFYEKISNEPYEFYCHNKLNNILDDIKKNAIYNKCNENILTESMKNEYNSFISDELTKIDIHRLLSDLLCSQIYNNHMFYHYRIRSNYLLFMLLLLYNYFDISLNEIQILLYREFYANDKFNVHPYHDKFNINDRSIFEKLINKHLHPKCNVNEDNIETDMTIDDKLQEIIKQL